MRIKPRGYYANRHSCFLLQYLLVLVTRYRHPVIAGDIETRLLEYTGKYFKERNCVINAIECMPNHMHILFDAPPQINLADFINAYKSASSKILRKEFPDILRQYYQEPYFWNLSYFIGSVSDRTETAVKSYIEHQKDEAFTHD